MRRLLVLGTCAASFGGLLAGGASALTQPSTTNAPAIFTVKVTLTDHKVVMTPGHAVRGSTVTFILTNRGKKRHTLVFGQTNKVGSQGFDRTLAPDGQARVVMYLNFRGVLRYTLLVPKVKAAVARGAFRVT